MHITGYPNVLRRHGVREVAQFFKILADEARLQILWLLFNHTELCVCDVMEALRITQSKASRHLATLRHAGLVVDRKDGAWSYYSARKPESDLERAQLDLLRSSLAEHPGAANVLQALHDWLGHRDRTGACSPDAANNGASRRAEVPMAGKRSSRGSAAGGRATGGSAGKLLRPLSANRSNSPQSKQAHSEGDRR
jgi:ArsR family transcriptional regulator, arsenate/arsenite/antimonite-responsive transcriptional repressor